MSTLSASPHIRGKKTTRSLMTDVIIALIPATAVGIWRFGWYAAVVTAVCIASCVLSEFCFEKARKMPITISDGSAVLTGLLLALNLPPGVPIWIPILGSAFAILMVKQVFGGLGQNFMNPALAARCFLLISFAAQMNDFSVDGVSGATPLALARTGEALPPLSDLFLGTSIGGTIGEVSALALIAGGIYLLIRGVISWRIPVCCLLSFAVFTGAFSGFDGAFVLSQLLMGGLLLGAIFMATDYVTSPITPWGKVLYGVLIGFLTALFRKFGANPEGTSFAILIGNMVTPLIEKITAPRVFGVGKKKAEKPQAEETTAVAEEPHKADHRKNLKVVIVLTCITLLAGLVLGYFHQLTEAPIARQKENKAQEAYRAVFPAADSFEDTEQPPKDGDEVTVDRVLTALSDGKQVGSVVCVTSHEGYGGDISLAVGVDSEGTVTGISFLAISETAGLGMNAQDPGFYGQFEGTKPPLNVVKGTAGDGEISAISGATVTSKAVTAAVNAASEAAEGGAK